MLTHSIKLRDTIIETEMPLQTDDIIAVNKLAGLVVYYDGKTEAPILVD